MQNIKPVPATRTKQFVVGNVGFFKDGKAVKRNSPFAKLLMANLAVLKITNQKNGCMGQTITQHATTTPHFPVKTLAHIVHDILLLGGTDATLICLVRMGTKWQDVTSQNMVVMVRQTARLLNLQDQAIDPDLIGAHSLRADGAMALKLHGYDDITIMKMGRWTSLTFTQYIQPNFAPVKGHIVQDEHPPPIC